MKIQNLKDLAKSAFAELKKIQTGEKKIVKSGMKMIDSHIGGLLPGDVILFSGLSGHGKSATLYQLKDNILNKEINEEAEDYAFLDMSLEMKIFNIILRGIHDRLDKKKRDILFNEFNDDEKEIAKRYYESLQDDRQYVNQAPATPKEFFDGARQFLIDHKNKKAVFISIDHMLLLQGSDKQKVIEQTVEAINLLKLEFDNAYFILLSQLNRGLLTRVEEKNNRSAPNATDLFGSSFMDQIASYNIILFNPYKAGIEQYMKVNPERYEYLSDHFGEEDSKGRVSFNTTGKIFYHIEKTRESDDPYKDIYIKEMNLSKDQLEKLQEPKLEPVVPEFSRTGKAPELPVFDNPNDVKPVTDMSVAFDEPVNFNTALTGDEDPPF
jgi:replicative DNA helicase